MPLTDTAVRNAKPGDKPVKMFDERAVPDSYPCRG